MFLLVLLEGFLWVVLSFYLSYPLLMYLPNGQWCPGTLHETVVTSFFGQGFHALVAHYFW